MILGIDPGLANNGWAIISQKSESLKSKVKNENCEYGLIDCGVVITKEGEDRLGIIYEEVEKLIKKHQPKRMAIESLFFAKNAKSAIGVAEAIGVIKLCGQKNGVEVSMYTPLQIKMALVGYGRAEKEQVEVMVRNILGLEKLISPSHASDAVAVALTDLFTNNKLI